MFRQMACSLMSLFGLTSLLVTSLISCVKYQVAHMFTVSNQLLDLGKKCLMYARHLYLSPSL